MTDANDMIECPICLCEVPEANQVKTANCKHRFCISCIKRWLESNPTCPLDRGYVSELWKVNEKQKKHEIVSIAFFLHPDLSKNLVMHMKHYMEKYKRIYRHLLDSHSSLNDHIVLLNESSPIQTLSVHEYMTCMHPIIKDYVDNFDRSDKGIRSIIEDIEIVLQNMPNKMALMEYFHKLENLIVLFSLLNHVNRILIHTRRLLKPFAAPTEKSSFITKITLERFTETLEAIQKFNDLISDYFSYSRSLILKIFRNSEISDLDMFSDSYDHCLICSDPLHNESKALSFTCKHRICNWCSQQFLLPKLVCPINHGVLDGICAGMVETKTKNIIKENDSVLLKALNEIPKFCNFTSKLFSEILKEQNMQESQYDQLVLQQVWDNHYIVLYDLALKQAISTDYINTRLIHTKQNLACMTFLDLCFCLLKRQIKFILKMPKAKHLTEKSTRKEYQNTLKTKIAELHREILNAVETEVFEDEDLMSLSEEDFAVSLIVEKFYYVRQILTFGFC